MTSEQDNSFQSIIVGLDGKKIPVLELCDEHFSKGKKYAGLYNWHFKKTYE